MITEYLGLWGMDLGVCGLWFAGFGVFGFFGFRGLGFRGQGLEVFRLGMKGLGFWGAHPKRTSPKPKTLTETLFKFEKTPINPKLIL